MYVLCKVCKVLRRWKGHLALAAHVDAVNGDAAHQNVCQLHRSLPSGCVGLSMLMQERRNLPSATSARGVPGSKNVQFGGRIQTREHSQGVGNLNTTVALRAAS